METLWQQQNNNMAAMRYYGTVMTGWWMADQHLLIKETSSVYDCTVEDVEYICNGNSTLIYICNKLSLRVYCCCCRCSLQLRQYSRRLNLFLFFFRRVRKAGRSDWERRHVFLSAYPSTWNSASTGRIFMKFDIWVLFENPLRKFKVSLNFDKNNRHLTWRPIYIFFIISLSSSYNMNCFIQTLCTEN